MRPMLPFADPLPGCRAPDGGFARYCLCSGRCVNCASRRVGGEQEDEFQGQPGRDAAAHGPARSALRDPGALGAARRPPADLPPAAGQRGRHHSQHAQHPHQGTARGRPARTRTGRLLPDALGCRPPQAPGRPARVRGQVGGAANPQESRCRTMNALHATLDPTVCLPDDANQAVLVGRAWVDGQGAVPVRVTPDAVHDLSGLAPTISHLLELPDPAASVRSHGGPLLASTDAVLANSAWDLRARDIPWLMAPCDLQAIKAAGVTFVASMLERVIEEQARGDASKAEDVRRAVVAVIGDNLSAVKPGSPQAMKLKDVLIAQNMWSQYLEVGIGPDAEVFTKSQPMSAVGTGAEIGLHPNSVWNNPEPEIVLAVDSRGQVKGATLGNDVNLRDFEGRSALLLGKAKDNNGSCAIGPLLRLFDGQFGIADVRRCDLSLQVRGPEGFVLDGSSSLTMISRDPLDLVA